MTYSPQPAYSQKQLELDEKMQALGRPVPPVVSWLKTRPLHVKGKPAWDAATASWRFAIEAWEKAHPDDAVTWSELREAYIAEEDTLESRKWSENDWGYETLKRRGAPQTSIDAIRRTLDDRGCYRETRDWMLSGKWSLVLCGPPGCGKTTAAAWAAHQLVMRKHRPIWIRCPATAAGALFGVEAEVLKFKCRTADVLVLDDIGAGATELGAKHWIQWLDDVIDARWGAKRKTIITGNRNAAALTAWLGARLSDRLNEGSVYETTEKSMRGHQ